MTKDQIIEELSATRIENVRLKEKDKYIRQQFTQTLQNYYPMDTTYGNSKQALTWESIFFKMGELNSDANYSILLGEHQIAQNHIRELQTKGEIK